jgi:glycosyltransferase involved in cell wall biosynthesis
MKLFEYMAMEKAIIAPAVGPVKEVLNNGETGLLITPGSASEMAREIVRLAGDPALRRRLGTAGRAYVVANHTWRQNAIKALEAYARIRPVGG